MRACVCARVCMGGILLSLQPSATSNEEKKKAETKLKECVGFRVAHLQLASLLPLSVHNGAQKERVFLPLPPPALPGVCKQISAHVISRFASQLSSPSALPRLLCPPICRQKEAERAAADEWCSCEHARVRVSVCAQLRAAHVHVRRRQETLAAKSREARNMTTKTKAVCEMEVRKKKTSPPSPPHTQNCVQSCTRMFFFFISVSPYF